jgi:hydrogenase maturation protease
MTEPRILLLGVGNILYTDEGVGVHAVRRLETDHVFSDNVSLLDGGVMGKLLMPAIMDCDRLIILDAVLGGEAPGTLYRLEGEGLRKSLGFRDSQHQVDLVDTLISCELAGSRPETVVIGMEPADWKTLGMELSGRCRERLPALISHALAELRAAGGEARPSPGGAAAGA